MSHAALAGHRPGVQAGKHGPAARLGTHLAARQQQLRADREPPEYRIATAIRLVRLRGRDLRGCVLPAGARAQLPVGALQPGQRAGLPCSVGALGNRAVLRFARLAGVLAGALLGRPIRGRAGPVVAGALLRRIGHRYASRAGGCRHRRPEHHRKCAGPQRAQLDVALVRVEHQRHVVDLEATVGHLADADARQLCARTFRPALRVLAFHGDQRPVHVAHLQVEAFDANLTVRSVGARRSAGGFAYPLTTAHHATDEPARRVHVQRQVHSHVARRDAVDGACAAEDSDDGIGAHVDRGDRHAGSLCAAQRQAVQPNRRQPQPHLPNLGLQAETRARLLRHLLLDELG
jgi:hypothetical protein